LSGFDRIPPVFTQKTAFSRISCYLSSATITRILGLLAATAALIERLSVMSKARSRDMQFTRLGKSVAPPSDTDNQPARHCHDHTVSWKSLLEPRQIKQKENALTERTLWIPAAPFCSHPELLKFEPDLPRE
jgi:hypothetical protein